MDAEALDLPASTFHAVLCRWGLMYLPNLATALQGMRRLLVPGGYFAAAVWDAPSRVPLIELAMRALSEQLQTPPPVTGMPGPFSLAGVGYLKRTLRCAGLTNVHAERLAVTFHLASADEYTCLHQPVYTPFYSLLARQPAEQQARLWHAVTEAARQQAQDDGTLQLSNTVICVAGRRRAAPARGRERRRR